MKSFLEPSRRSRSTYLCVSAFVLTALSTQPLSAELKATKKQGTNSSQIEQLSDNSLENKRSAIQVPGNTYEAWVILPFTNQVKKVKYRVSKSGDAIYQGDINLGSAYAVQQQSQKYEEQSGDSRTTIKAARSDDSYRWRNGVVPYKISNGFNDATINAIKAGIDELNRKTLIKIVPYEKKAHPDYVNIVKMDDDEPGGGSSSVGRMGGQQKLSLKQNADSAATMHEFMHALGFLHEHNRADRDNWVTVKWNNIAEESKHNFNKMDGDDFMFGDYDVKSIMHYDGFAFSKSCDITRFGRGLKCGTCKTINDVTTKRNQCYVTIQDRATKKAFVRSQSLSPNDIADINALYPEEVESNSLPSVTSLRTLRTTVERVVTREGPAESGVCGTKTDYVYKLEAGPVTSLPGVLENALVRTETTKKHVDKPYRSNDFRPSDWRLTTPISPGTELVRVDIKLWDHDDAICGGKDDIVDINPYLDLAILHLLVDTKTGDLFYLKKNPSPLPDQNSFPRGDRVGNIFDSKAGKYLTQKFNGLLDGRVDYKDESEIHLKLEIL